MRGYAVEVLGELMAKEHSKDIAKLLQDKGGYTDLWHRRVAQCMPGTTLLRLTALMVLEKFEAKEYANDIKLLLNNKNEYVSKAAKEVLKKWGVDIGGQKSEGGNQK